MKRFAIVGAAICAWLLAGSAATAAPPAGPPYPQPVPGQDVYDYAGIFKPDTISSAEKVIASIDERTGARIIVYTQVKPESDTQSRADEDARALLNQWAIGNDGFANGLVILFDLQADGLTCEGSFFAGGTSKISEATRSLIFYRDMQPLLAQGDFDGALSIALTRIGGATAPAAGPPYPAAVNGQRVYDYAGIFKPATIAGAEQLIAGVEKRTGAQVAVYTQVKPESDDLDKANADALALMNQWGVGRKGFDDGLVILFDMQDNLRHGQVSLYAGAGYRAAFLSDSDRQDIFDNQMKPLLVDGDLDGGLLAGLRAVDANATPEHAAALERGRQINAVLVLLGLLAGLLLILWASFSWVRYGRDAVYIDDSSILMPAPPEGLTPAMATLLMSDRTTDRTISTALMDMAARGAIAFKQEIRKIANNPERVGITYLGKGDGTVGKSEQSILDSIQKHSASYDGYISSSRLYHLNEAFDECKENLEKSAVEHGWLRRQPGEVVMRWALVGGLEITAAIVLGILWLITQVSALFVLTAALAVAGIVTCVLSYYMPARTQKGAMLYSMLSAYKRSLGLSMTASASVPEVVERHALPWIKTPDQVVVWGIALGLNTELEQILERTFANAPGEETGQTGYVSTWSPVWWTTAGHGHASGFAGGSGGSISSGLFSSGGIPDPGSIVAALGSMASPSSPASSSSSSGGGFSSGGFGGGGGGGGGGAGGGF